jgi:hypothetical protein
MRRLDLAHARRVRRWLAFSCLLRWAMVAYSGWTLGSVLASGHADINPFAIFIIQAVVLWNEVECDRRFNVKK